MFDAGGPQWHFITSALSAERFPPHVSADTLVQNLLLVWFIPSFHWH